MLFRSIEAYRRKEQGRRRWLADYRQWERYRVTLGDKCPRSFQTFLRHKRAGDEKYQKWMWEYRWESKRLSFQALIGQQTSTGIPITGISRHVVDRAISRGFTADAAIDALQNPVKIGIVKTDSQGRPSQQFTGARASVTINPETGNIVTGWKK